MAEKRKAYSLVELTIVVLIIVALTFIAVPKLQFGALYRKQADTVARKIVTDLRRTRSLAVSNAANNTVGYKLQMTGSAPYAGYQIIDANSAEVIDSHTVESPVNCTGGNEFIFGPLGNLLTGSDTELTAAYGQKTFTVTIVSATGAIVCTEN